jgi:type IV fimbrial biogenesis protein FimT
MYPISLPRGAGFTMLETLVAMAIVAISLGYGIPQIADWVRATKVESATEFYSEGFRLARGEAVKRNAVSRISFNAGGNGQLDWQVDLCFPTPAVKCTDATGTWSTPETATAAEADPDKAGGFKSVFRSADALPGTNVLQQTLFPIGANEVYFTPLGWVDTTVAPRVTLLKMEPAAGSNLQFAQSAIAVTLSGMASKCLPDAAAHDSRGCPE